MANTLFNRCNPTSVVALFLAAAALALFPLAADAGPKVLVQLVSGRVLDAEAAPRTDAQRLWLVYRSNSATLHRPIAWDRIATAQLNGEALPPAEFKAAVLDQLAAPQDEAPTANEPAPSQIPPAVASQESIADEALNLLFAAPRVVSVNFDAHLANWDADIEADGLIIHVRPIDAAGRVVPVRGTVYADLHGPRQISFSDGPHLRGHRIDKLGSWTKQIVPAQVHADGAWFKLPFQAAQPEFDTALGRLGLVHVRLVVPGEGVFESSIDGVRIRPYSPLRDDLERVHGRRFLANERTGRGK